MAKLTTLRNKVTQEVLYPVTKTNAVSDSNGTSLDSLLSGKVSPSQLLNLVYPIGSIYIGDENSSSPASWIGGTWERLPDNYTLWSASSGAYDGTNGIISAGLPNITGEIGGATGWWNNSGYATGAFTKGDKNGEVGSSGSAIGKYRVYFNASHSNRIYGNSSTVQPPAIKVNMWRRTA